MYFLLNMAIFHLHVMLPEVGVSPNHPFKKALEPLFSPSILGGFPSIFGSTPRLILCF